LKVPDTEGVREQCLRSSEASYEMRHFRVLSYPEEAEPAHPPGPLESGGMEKEITSSEKRVMDV